MSYRINSEMINRLGKFFLPFVIGMFGIFAFQLALILISEGESSAKLMILMIGYFLPPLGKESIIPIGVSGGQILNPITNDIVVIPSINPLIMAFSIAFIDIIVALFLVWNYDLAKKIPFVGKFMEKVETIGKSASDKYGWIKPLKFIGIVLFVMVPFQGSGGLVGSIVGRLIGMKPWNIFMAITSGAIIGCVMIAYFADAILGVLVKNFMLGLLLLIVILMVIVMIFVYRKSVNHKKSIKNKSN